MMKINPHRIRGSWEDGYVLDVHSTGSTFLGYDEFGHTVFDTNRTEMGELLYLLKYKGDVSVLSEIGAFSELFIRSWNIDFNIIVPVLPTRPRSVQPVFQIADELASRFGVSVLRSAVRKLKNIEELKNIHEFEERRNVLENALAADSRQVNGARVFLVDDLIRSGATMNAVAEVLKSAGAVSVYAFALTQTRRI